MLPTAEPRPILPLLVSAPPHGGAAFCGAPPPPSLPGAADPGAPGGPQKKRKKRKAKKSCGECGRKEPLEACSACGAAFCDEHDSDSLIYPINHKEGCDKEEDCGCHEERGELPPLCHDCADAAGV